MDNASSYDLLKFLAPKLPSMLKATVFHTLSMSPTSSKWDLRTELTVTVLRSMLDGPQTTITKQQRRLNRDDAPVKGRMWISRYTMPPPPEDDARQALIRAIEDLKEGSESFTPPSMDPVSAEWTGYRANVAKDAPEPSISESEKFAGLMKEVTSDVTILYFHGGAHYLCDPATHRGVTAKLAHLTGGRVLSVRYRLAPKYPFPSALLDALVAYLSLLHPPPGALHEAVPADKIVFAGDSAGGNVCFALLLLLLHLQRAASESPSEPLTFHGTTLPSPLPLPAGVATNSPWVDMTRSMPSLSANSTYDYLPPPSASAASRFAPCPLWPTTPPRSDIYCDGTMLCHPLVSPLAAPASAWAGSPPLFVVVGEEMLRDEGAVVAQRAARVGVPVLWEQWEAMPHCFGLVLVGGREARECFETWAGFCRSVVEKGPESVQTKGVATEARTCKRSEVDVKALVSITDEEVTERMTKAKEARLKGEEAEGKTLPKL